MQDANFVTYFYYKNTSKKQTYLRSPCPSWPSSPSPHENTQPSDVRARKCRASAFDAILTATWFSRPATSSANWQMNTPCITSHSSTSNHLSCDRPLGRTHHMSCPSLCLSVCPTQAHNSKTNSKKNIESQKLATTCTANFDSKSHLPIVPSSEVESKVQHRIKPNSSRMKQTKDHNCTM